MRRIKFLLPIWLMTFAIGVGGVQQARKNFSLALGNNGQTQTSVKNPYLREELLQRMKTDQDLQKEVLGKVLSGREIPLELLEKRRENEALNTEWIKRVIEQNGYPGFALVGRDGAAAADFLLFQHTKKDVPFQKKVLELMRKAVAENDADSNSLAAMTDLVLVGEGKPQVFGTHLRPSNDVLKTSPVADEADIGKTDLPLPQTVEESIKPAQSNPKIRDCWH